VKARVAALPPRTLRLLAVGAVLLYALALWFLVVSPKRAEVAALGTEIEAAELELAEARAASQNPATSGVPVSDVFRLAKAMPGSDDQSGLLLELGLLAKSTGVELRSVTPQTVVTGAGGETMIPVAVTVGGSYFQISKFLRRTESLVIVRGGAVRARGRLLAVKDLALVESVSEGFPELDAAITFNAFVYDGPILPPEVEAPAADEDPSTGTSAAGSAS
jgi:Tfp pilus assembly protein PilO